jgi:hypothetical protein
VSTAEQEGEHPFDARATLVQVLDTAPEVVVHVDFDLPPVVALEILVVELATTTIPL